jgi:hypothetical protein
VVVAVSVVLVAVTVVVVVVPVIVVVVAVTVVVVVAVTVVVVAVIVVVVVSLIVVVVAVTVVDVTVEHPSEAVYESKLTFTTRSSCENCCVIKMGHAVKLKRRSEQTEITAKTEVEIAGGFQERG